MRIFLTLTNLSSNPMSAFAPAVTLWSPSLPLLSHCNHHPCRDCRVAATIPAATATSAVAVILPPLCHCIVITPAAIVVVSQLLLLVLGEGAGAGGRGHVGGRQEHSCSCFCCVSRRGALCPCCAVTCCDAATPLPCSTSKACGNM